jgi:hypothetical protein
MGCHYGRSVVKLQNTFVRNCIVKSTPNMTLSYWSKLSKCKLFLFCPFVLQRSKSSAKIAEFEVKSLIILSKTPDQEENKTTQHFILLRRIRINIYVYPCITQRTFLGVLLMVSCKLQPSEVLAQTIKELSNT